MFVVDRRGIFHILVRDATEVLALGAGRKTPHGLAYPSPSRGKHTTMAMDPPGSTTTTTHINNPSNSSSRRRSRSRCKKWENYLFVAILLQSVALIVLFEKVQGNARANKLKHEQEFQATNNDHDNTNDDPKDGQTKTIITGG
eukprot:scaffold22175_cov113-Skeletonema_marinoi.AAC.1